MKERLKIFLAKTMKFPIGLYDKNGKLWWAKDVCLPCIRNPIECLSNKDYMEKYPTTCCLNIGAEHIYLCDYHARLLLNELKKHFGEEIEKENEQ